MKLRDLLKEVLEDNYPPFKTNKAIRVGDKLVTMGRWTFTGKESGGKGVYMNVINKQTLAFDMAELQALSTSNPNDIEVLKEGVTPEAAQLHAMVNCGQDAAQDFFDEHNIDAKKLVAYVQQNKRTNPTLVYDVRDYISGARGTVGGEKNLRDKFIKQFQNSAPMREGVSWKPSSNANVEGFASKSFPYGGKGDALLSKPEFISKWAPRIQAWIGVEPKLDLVQSFFPSQQGMDFKFEGSDGKTYRIYSPGESSNSKQYVVQKMKNI